MGGKKNKKKRHRGRYCVICGQSRPNEQFGAKGNTCKRCKQTVPKLERESIRSKDFMASMFHRQKNISAGNVETLKKFAESEDLQTAEMAKVLIEVAKVKSHKKRRLKFLWKNNRSLLEELFRVGVLYYDDLFQDDAFIHQFGDDGMTEDGELLPGEEWEDPEYWNAEIPF